MTDPVTNAATAASAMQAALATLITAKAALVTAEASYQAACQVKAQALADVSTAQDAFDSSVSAIHMLGA